MQIDWDPGKAKRNLVKHGISFDEASEVFADQFAITVSDLKHSENEDREQTIGLSTRLRVLMVVHTLRKGKTIWIISARKATRREVNDYEAELKNRIKKH